MNSVRISARGGSDADAYALEGRPGLLFFETSEQCAHWHANVWSHRNVLSAVPLRKEEVEQERHLPSALASPYRLLLPDVARGVCSVGSKVAGWEYVVDDNCTDSRLGV